VACKPRWRISHTAHQRHGVTAAQRQSFTRYRRPGHADVRRRLRTALYQAATVMLRRGASNWLKDGRCAWRCCAAVGDGQKARNYFPGPVDRRGASPHVAGRHQFPLHARGGDGAPDGIGAVLPHWPSTGRGGKDPA